MNENKEFLPIENRVEDDVSKADIVTEDLRTEDLFQEFVKIDKEIFPGMEIEESELRETFESEGIQVALRDSQGVLIGYLLSVPYEQAITFLLPDDPLLSPKEKTLYVESIGILPTHRSIKNVLSIWNSLRDEAVKRGYNTINGHFRVSQGLSRVVQRKLNGKYFRTIENWVGYREPFDYLEINLVDEK
jgi:hypothetical protein